jgi:hypothetical protein
VLVKRFRTSQLTKRTFLILANKYPETAVDPVKTYMRDKEVAVMPRGARKVKPLPNVRCDGFEAKRSRRDVTRAVTLTSGSNCVGDGDAFA